LNSSKKQLRVINNNRLTVLGILIILQFTIILSRLSYLQIVNAEEAQELANIRAVRQIPEPAPRGEIFDINGIKLATNVQSYTLVYMETEESRKDFFTTFGKVFNILENSERINEKGEVEYEKLQDDFELKINPFRFEFNSSDPSVKRASELRFKRDRAFDFRLERKLFRNNRDKMTDRDKAIIDEEVLQITAEEVFRTLVIDYGLFKLLELPLEEERIFLENSTAKEVTDKLLQRYTLEDIRKYMIVKDAVKMQSFSGYKPITVASNIDKNTAFIFEQLKHDLPGIDIVMQPIRYYPYNELGSSFIGYISKISGDRRDTYEERGYDISTDYIGIAGLESAFEDRLRGTKGGTTVKVNKHGRKTDELFRLEPYQGQSIVLTVDKDLQLATEKVLNDVMLHLQKNNLHPPDNINTANATRGAAVVLDVNTGAVLAMASNPGYDPNLFAVPGRLTSDLYRKYFNPDLVAFGEQYIIDKKLDKRKVDVDVLFPVRSSSGSSVVRDDFFDIYPKPFYNYATSSLIPPGSTFKMLTAIAGLEERVITPSTKILDAAVFDEHGEDTNNYGGACWIWNRFRGSHGFIDVKRALQVSCNYFFFEVSYRMYKQSGRDSLARYAWQFGLGVDPLTNAKPSTGIEIPERFGQVYNHESRKMISARLYRFGLVDLLNRQKGFKPLEIADMDTDSIKLREAKTVFKDALANEIMLDGSFVEEYTNFKGNRLPVLVRDLLDAYPKSMREAYMENDIRKNIDIIADYIYYTVKREVLTPGNIYDASIGQGTSQFTPLQLANYMATIVNGGDRYRVRLVDSFLSPEGEIIEDVKPEIIEQVELSSRTLAAVKEGMRLVNEDGGSAAKAFSNFPIETGGKTGSATFREDQHIYGRTAYGLYLGFAPFDKPEIAVCVVIFDGGSGGLVAPVARGIYEAYFKDVLKENHPNYVPRFEYTFDPQS
jgi:penicillin-binding protein 2